MTPLYSSPRIELRMLRLFNRDVWGRRSVGEMSIGSSWVLGTDVCSLCYGPRIIVGCFISNLQVSRISANYLKYFKINLETTARIAEALYGSVWAVR